MTSASSSTVSNSYTFEPLRVRADLRCGVVSDPWLPLDGILFYQSVRDDLGRQDLTVPGRSLLADPMRGTKMPLKIVHGNIWYYRCSWAQWGPYADGQDYWNKRFDNSLADLIDFRGRRGKVIIDKSTYKAYNMPVYYRHALYVEWYCVGDRERIEYLLSTCTHIGKKTSQGWGRVAKWHVDPVEADWSIWRDGRLMRGIPPGDLPEVYPLDLRQGYYGVRPSYWDSRNQMALVLPPESAHG